MKSVVQTLFSKTVTTIWSDWTTDRASSKPRFLTCNIEEGQLRELNETVPIKHLAQSLVNAFSNH